MRNLLDTTSLAFYVPVDFFLKSKKKKKKQGKNEIMTRKSMSQKKTRREINLR